MRWNGSEHSSAFESRSEPGTSDAVAELSRSADFPNAAAAASHAVEDEAGGQNAPRDHYGGFSGDHRTGLCGTTGRTDSPAGGDIPQRSGASGSAFGHRGNAGARIAGVHPVPFRMRG